MKKKKRGKTLLVPLNKYTVEELEDFISRIDEVLTGKRKTAFDLDELAPYEDTSDGVRTQATHRELLDMVKALAEGALADKKRKNGI